MKNHQPIFPIEKMALVLEVSRSSYYRPEKPSKRSLENQEIVRKIREIYYKSRGTYGSPRIHAALRKAEVECSRLRVAKLMKAAQLQAKMVKAWKHVRISPFYDSNPIIGRTKNTDDRYCDNINQRVNLVPRGPRIW